MRSARGPLVTILLLLPGCLNHPVGSGEVEGALSGQPLAVHDAVFGHDFDSDIFGSTAPTEQVYIQITDAYRVCGVVNDQDVPRGATWITLSFFPRSDASAFSLEPGTYPLFEESPFDLEVHGSRLDASCEHVYSAAATAGSVRIDAVDVSTDADGFASGGTVTGAFEATLDGETVSGQFEAVYCRNAFYLGGGGTCVDTETPPE